jgi:hypothetical protein
MDLQDSAPHLFGEPWKGRQCRRGEKVDGQPEAFGLEAIELVPDPRGFRILRKVKQAEGKDAGDDEAVSGRIARGVFQKGEGV